MYVAMCLRAQTKETWTLHSIGIANSASKVEPFQHYSANTTQTLPPPPPESSVPTVTENKVQLIDLICQQRIENGQTEIQPTTHKLFITGWDPAHGVLTNRDDLQTSHEEAGVIIVQQMTHATHDGSSNINIKCDNTDVFVVLHY